MVTRACVWDWGFARCGSAARALRWPLRLGVFLGVVPMLGCTATVESKSGRTGEAPSLTVVAQRVTATVKREALRLVRLETERGSVLTTPEHPFAMPGSGWNSAGRLVLGDELVSERFGAVRLSSVRDEVVAQPVPVFNLSVASSHTYFVGTDGVLVHNGKCKPSEVREEEIKRLLREREEIVREIRALTKSTPTSPRLAELKSQREALRQRLSSARRAQRRTQGVTVPSRDERTRQHFAAEHEVARKGLEEAQLQLAKLERGGQSANGEQSALVARKKLEQQILEFQLSYERTSRILAWLAELAELDTDTSATGADGRVLEERRNELRAKLKLERSRQSHLKYMRRMRAAPVRRKELEQHNLARKHRIPRRGAVVGRARGRPVLLEEELARRLQEFPSESRDARIHHLTDQIETMKQMMALLRQYARVKQGRLKYRKERENLLAVGGDTSEIGRKLEQAKRDCQAFSLELAKLRVRARQLARLDADPGADAPGSVDEARLHEFEGQLAAGLADEQALAGIERGLDAMELPHADWDAVLVEVDDLLSEPEELTRQGALPDRAGRLESSYARLERELRGERAAMEVAVSELANESAYIQTTQASSSSGASWQERLSRIREEEEGLRAHWRAGLRARLDSARRQLDLLRSVQAFRDEDVEAELVREIALLERELQRAGG